MLKPAFNTTCKIGLCFSQPFWVVKIPALEELKADFKKAMTEEVFRAQVSQNVTIRLRVDGLWELDLSGISSCASVNMPAYEDTTAEKAASDKYYKALETATEHIRSQVRYANALKACFIASMQSKQSNYLPIDAPETPSDFLPLPEAYFSRFGTDLNPNKLSTYQIRNRVEIFLEAAISVSSGNLLPERTLVHRDTLQYAVELFAEIVRRGDGFALLFDLLYHRQYLYYCHRFSESLLGAWSITETALFQQWNVYLEKCKAEGNPIASKRMKEKLNDGKAFTASVVQEVLNLAGQLDHKEYQELDAVRKARNAWVHNLRAVSKKDAEQALTLCRAMVKKTYGLDFGLSISLHTTPAPQNPLDEPTKIFSTIFSVPSSEEETPQTFFLPSL